MCCSAQPSIFKGTGLVGKLTVHPTEGQVFSMIYQNTALNLSSGPNAMILHLPAAEKVSRKNFVDTELCPNIVDDAIEALRPKSRGILSLGGSDGLIKGFEIFEHGIYTVVIAENAHYAKEALQEVPENKRPYISREILEFYDEKYPGWALPICCFDNRQVKKATPLLIWYKPTNPKQFHLPAIDSHDGNSPDLNSAVEVDHWVIFGSDELEETKKGAPVYYSKLIPETVRPFLPQRVIGKRFQGMMPNGDFTIAAKDVSVGDIRQIQRVAPTL